MDTQHEDAGAPTNGEANASWVTAPPRPHAGWFADPEHPTRQRWWDGSQWTSTVADGAVISWDPTTVEPPHVEPPGARGLGVAILGYVVGVGLAFMVVFLMRNSGARRRGPLIMACSELGLWAGLIGACVLVSRRRGVGSFRADYGWAFRWSDIGIGFAAAIAGRVLAMYAAVPFAWLFKNTDHSNQAVFDGLLHTTAGWIVLVTMLCVGAPLVEEVFFRGLIQTRLIGRWGPVVGIGVSSVLFGAAHLIGWRGPISLIYAVAVSAGGVVLGVVRYLTGRLGTSIAAHAFFNAHVVVILAVLSSR